MGARTTACAVHVLGGGSNVVIADEGFDGLVVSVEHSRRSSQRSRRRTAYATAPARASHGIAFVAQTVADEAAGLECLSGIPVRSAARRCRTSAPTARTCRRRSRAFRPSIGRRRAGQLFRTRVRLRLPHQPLQARDATAIVVTRVEFCVDAEGRRRWPMPTSWRTSSIGDAAAVVAASARRDPRRSAAAKGMVIEAAIPPIAARLVLRQSRSCRAHQLDCVRTTAGAESVPHYRGGRASVKIPAAWLIERAGFPKGTRAARSAFRRFRRRQSSITAAARAADVLALAATSSARCGTRLASRSCPSRCLSAFRRSPELQWSCSSRYRTSMKDEAR